MSTARPSSASADVLSMQVRANAVRIFVIILSQLGNTQGRPFEFLRKQKLLALETCTAVALRLFLISSLFSKL